jgi:hypothetical protein
MNALPIVGPIVGGLLGAGASRSAANTQASAADRASQLQYEMFQQQREDLAPWRRAGEGALEQITAGQQPGGQFARRFTMDDFNADPGYQWRLQQGVNSLERGAAARGRLYSGAQGKALTRYGQDFGSSEFSNAYNRFRLDNSDIFNRYASTAGLGQTATNQQVQQSANLANRVGENMMGAGNARASGYVGGANALQNSIGQGLNYYQGQQLINRLPIYNIPQQQAPAPVYAGNTVWNPGYGPQTQPLDF